MKDKYIYYCDDCHCFVEENHRCQQWGTVSQMPKEAIDKLKLELLPKHETVEQWEERTGLIYPDDGPVWVIAWIEFNKNKTVRDDKHVCLDVYSDAKKFYNPSKKIYVATHHGKPDSIGGEYDKA